jgi:hypothetical protein
MKNDIIDPTDVGIVLFGQDQAVQESTAFHNTILNAGHSAWGSLGLDTGECSGCLFSGPGIHDNLILAGRSQHIDLMLYVGTGPWLAPSCPAGRGCGSGGVMTGNATIWGDEEQRIVVQHSIVVDGMLNAFDQGNALFIQPKNIGRCYHGHGVRNHSTVDASGSLMLEDVGPVHNCIGH